MAQKGTLLIDNFGFELSKSAIVEDRGDGKVVIRGEFARADIPTENKRIYPKSLWERELKRIKPQIESKKVYGLCDHPESGRTTLADASHLITKLWMDGDIVMGEAEILNTTKGKDLKAILEASGKIGVSSRGFGTTRPNQEGKDVVQDDYRLATWDAVADPANTSSYPEIHTEDQTVDTSTVKTETKTVPAPKAEAGKRLPVSEASLKKQSLAELKESNPSIYESFMDDAQREFEKRGAEIWAAKIAAAKESASADLKATFAENLKAAIEAAKAEVAEQERERLMNDPTVAGAKQALEAVKEMLRPYILPQDMEAIMSAKDKVVSTIESKLADAELKIANLTTENAKLTSMVKEAGYKYHLETLLRDVPQAESIRKLVGDVALCESLDALNKKVGDAVDAIMTEEKKRTARDEEIEKLKKENLILREASEKALEATKLQAVQVYADERLRFHPKAGQIRGLFEAKAPESRAAVDEVLSKFREKKADQQTLDEARSRVRKMVGSGTAEYLEESETTKGKGPGTARAMTESTGGLIHGQPVDQLRVLAGIDE